MIIPLFTFGSIYSTNTSWAEQMRETNNSNIIKHNRVKIPTGQRQTSWLFTSMAQDLNSGLPRANPASGQGGT